MEREREKERGSNILSTTDIYFLFVEVHYYSDRLFKIKKLGCAILHKQFCKNILSQTTLQSVIQMVVNGLFKLKTLRINLWLLSSFGKKRSLLSHHTKVLCINVDSIRLLHNVIYKASSHISPQPEVIVSTQMSYEMLEAKVSYKSWSILQFGMEPKKLPRVKLTGKCCRIL